VRFARLVENLEGEVLDIGLNLSIFVFMTNEVLCIEDAR